MWLILYGEAVQEEESLQTREDRERERVDAGSHNHDIHDAFIFVVIEEGKQISATDATNRNHTFEYSLDPKSLTSLLT